MIALLSALLLSNPAQATPAFTVEQALDLFATEMVTICELQPGDAEGRKTNTQVFNVVGADKVAYQVFEIPCLQGAYNFSSAYYVGSDVRGLELAHFAQPELAGAGKNPYLLKGYGTVSTLTNSVFSPAVSSLGFIDKHRGLGDCFTSGIYKLEGGRFVLKQYEVDYECDGKMKARKIVDIK